MKDYQTLAEFQRAKAEESGRVVVTLIRHPTLYPTWDRGGAARRAAHYVLCPGCDACRAEWEEWEAIAAAVRETRLATGEVVAA